MNIILRSVKVIVVPSSIYVGQMGIFAKRLDLHWLSFFEETIGQKKIHFLGGTPGPRRVLQICKYVSCSLIDVKLKKLEIFYLLKDCCTVK